MSLLSTNKENRRTGVPSVKRTRSSRGLVFGPGDKSHRGRQKSGAKKAILAGPCAPEINVTLPVLNEERCLVASVERVMETLGRFTTSYEVVIADNGSTDRTPALARELEQTYQPVRVVRLSQRGRGRALKAVWQSSGAEILSYMDIDLSTSLTHLPELIRPLQRIECDACIGSRRLKQSTTRRGLKRELISRAYIGLVQHWLGLSLSDFQCGFKAFRAAAVQSVLSLVRDDSWFFDTELLARIHWAGARIYELPVCWEEDTDSRVRILPTAMTNLRGLARLRREGSLCVERKRLA